MMSKEYQNITLHIDCHTMRFAVKREDEAVYRRAAVEIKTIYDKYADKYKDRSVDELWVLTCLELGVNLYSDIRDKSLEPVKDRIAAMEQKIQTELNNTKKTQ